MVRVVCSKAKWWIDLTHNRYTNQIVRLLRKQERLHFLREDAVKYVASKQTRRKFGRGARNEGEKRSIKHRHRFVFGIEGVISGKSRYCQHCDHTVLGFVHLRLPQQ